MRVLVTGGAGFIGSHLSEALVADGHEVVVLDNLSSGHEENLASVRSQIEFVEGDIRDRAAVQRALQRVEGVLHHAAVVSVPQSLADPVGSADVNVLGTARLLEECGPAGVKRFVFASSSAVYGDTPVVPTPEETETQPLSPYGTHKLTGEHFCRVASRTEGGPDCIAFRYFNVYGPRQSAESDYAAVIPKFRARCAEGQRPLIFGDGTQTRDFVHVRDVVEANRRALTSPGPWDGVAVNLARGEAVSILDLATLILELAQVDGAPELAPPRAGDIHRSIADITRLKRLMAWAPDISLRAGLQTLD